MKVIYNNILPFKGFSAINLFGVVFARKEYEPLRSSTIQHEGIHTAQMKELGYTYIEKLISMPAYNFTKEKADEAKKKLQEKKQELASMKNETPENMWLKDLDELEAKLKKMNYYC